jgi:hypothetical protein
MLEIKNIVVITQQSVGRNSELTFNFCNSFGIESSWEDLTTTAKITMPRKIIVKNKNNGDVSLYDTTFNVGGFNNDTPLILKGDAIQIYAGYKYRDKLGVWQNSTSLWFDGFVSGITPNKPFVIKCEDYSWKLKQLPAVQKIWKGYTINQMLTEMLSGTDITLNVTSNIGITYDVGYFDSTGLSVSQVLDKLRKEANLYSYIRGRELRVGYPVYVESEAKTHTFEFQKNIIENDLEYKRKEDVVLSALLKYTETEQNGTTKDGAAKTRQKGKQILIYYKNNEFRVEDVVNGKAPEAVEGERRTFNYLPNTSRDVMIADGKERLKKYYYTGFRGSITVFGYPFVQHGDNIKIINPVLNEMQNTYKVKKVVYSGGVNGLRQEITIDFKTA